VLFSGPDLNDVRLQTCQNMPYTYWSNHYCKYLKFEYNET